MPPATVPIMIRLPAKKVMDFTKYKHKQLSNWAPHEYKLKEFYLTEEEEKTAVPYSVIRKKYIASEKSFAEKVIQKQKLKEPEKPQEHKEETLEFQT
mmetsp:Transcript_9356/g.14187  ORF Transcript_9356/g.14187 Transcript_9356/m.14187 type:complete len:97 (+) Transcript_9356:1091-1381(+)